MFLPKKLFPKIAFSIDKMFVLVYTHIASLFSVEHLFFLLQ